MNLLEKLSRGYKRELRKEIRLLVIITIGFSISFAWRQTLFDAIISVVHKVFGIQGEVSSSITASIIITVLGLFLLLIGAKFLQEQY